MTMFSVVVPNFNHANFIRSRVDSILNQSFQDFELILLDDCSTDNSWDVLRSYEGNSKVSVIHRNSKNSQNPFNQWELGVKFAKGEYIWIAESDDFSDLYFLENIYNTFKNNSGIDFVFCRSIAVDENGNKIDELEWWYSDLDKFDLTKDFLFNGRDFITDFLSYKNIIVNASSVVFKREKFMTLPKLYRKMRLAGDWYIWINMLINSNGMYIASPLNYFRFHKNTVRNKLNNSIREMQERVIILKSLKIHRINHKHKLVFLKQTISIGLRSEKSFVICLKFSSLFMSLILTEPQALFNLILNRIKKLL